MDLLSVLQLKRTKVQISSLNSARCLGIFSYWESVSEPHTIVCSIENLSMHTSVHPHIADRVHP